MKKVAIVQHSPCLLDREATVQLATELVAESARAGAEPARPLRRRAFRVDAHDLHVGPPTEAEKPVPRPEAVVPPTGRHRHPQKPLHVPNALVEIGGRED